MYIKNYHSQEIRRKKIKRDLRKQKKKHYVRFSLHMHTLCMFTKFSIDFYSYAFFLYNSWLSAFEEERKTYDCKGVKEIRNKAYSVKIVFFSLLLM